MENKSLVLMGGGAALVVLGGLSIVWEKRQENERKEKKKEENKVEVKENTKDPFTSILLWYRKNLPLLYRPGIENELPLSKESENQVLQAWGPIHIESKFKSGDPNSLGRMIEGSEELVRNKTASGEWNYLQAVFFLSSLSESASFFDAKKIQMKAHKILKTENKRMHRVNEMHYMSAMVAWYLIDMKRYRKARDEVVEPLKYTRPLVDQKGSKDFGDLIRIRMRALACLSDIESAKKESANTFYLEGIKNEAWDIVLRYLTTQRAGREVYLNLKYKEVIFERLPFSEYPNKKWKYG